MTLFAVQNRVSAFFEKAALFVFCGQNPENSTFVIESGEFYRDKVDKHFWDLKKHADKVLNFTI